ncbi:MAG: NADH-quinone oxidoreductase subunit F [gamma proteobacterium symbiont of Stewartia floridana]|nr:NAD(P)H-dependent oxidoreductase subunit E [Candidatus Thiodiazotropha taylori]RLW55281.1 MAG: NADH-quinone oxidoreductase subunit F [gamma proteobacterium symbiont of Stewartia floridana]RLW57774.1 MAG: NADH-quinone oxidoreductase subunit F [gamma proteobacterium symbiont of Stewartia floridana]RLW63357.1 MAG: NADH-quinone oxidoreductase subunit F [gamma proteobacterium symbiont of Stewartia floridana]RLW65914.1 MAG: NADH-quinone oxidoreductase subunit F [gamma proteobacterium symbiont of S
MRPSVKTRERHFAQNKGRQIDPAASQTVCRLLQDTPRRPDLLIEALHKLQDHLGYISKDLLCALADEMNLSNAEVYEVASFYHHFDLINDGQSPPPALTIRVCESISCHLAGAEKLIHELTQVLGDKLRIQRVPCVGRCQNAPVAVVGKRPVSQADIHKVTQLVETGLTEPDLLEGYLDYKTYCAQGGYQLLQQIQSSAISGAETDPLSIEQVLTTLEGANLRGLGGAGFPAGRKWRILRDQPAPRLLAVNIDEGEPGTFKDRFYLEKDPHRFLEGALIAAKVVGIREIYIYLRDEYAAIRTMLERELSALQSKPPCALPAIHLRRGAGAYICGEESAMIESIEGKRGMPRQRPPYVAQVGLFGRPTLEHNMETLYWVRELLEKGADWFTRQGRNGRHGLRSFSVSGRVKNPGVYLAPAGITLQQLIDEYGGGMLEGHQLYAYFPGGASGGILPASLADIPLDFDTLQPHGCFIGSAAIIVLSQQDSVRDAALNAMRFFAHESCGQCTPCRVGTEKAVHLMEQKTWDRDLLEELSSVMIDASICGLGQAAPNPLLSVLKYFPQELQHGA